MITVSLVSYEDQAPEVRVVVVGAEGDGWSRGGRNASLLTLPPSLLAAEASTHWSGECCMSPFLRTGTQRRRKNPEFSNAPCVPGTVLGHVIKIISISFQKAFEVGVFTVSKVRVVWHSV